MENSNSLCQSGEIVLPHPSSPIEGSDKPIISTDTDEIDNTDQDEKQERFDQVKIPISNLDASIVSCGPELAKLVYKYSTSDVNKTHALLCQAINLSIHGDYYAAKDLLLLSRLQETINTAEIR